MRLRMLLCGNTLVASVCCEGTSPHPPNCRIVSLRKTIPSFRKLTTVQLGPASAGPFLVSKHLGTISRVPGFALVRKKRDLPQHDETKLKPRFGGAFFALRRARATIARFLLCSLGLFPEMGPAMAASV